MNKTQYKGGVILGTKLDGIKYTQVEAFNFFMSNLKSVRVLTDQTISGIILVLDLSDTQKSPYISHRPTFTNSNNTETLVNSVLLKIMLNDRDILPSLATGKPSKNTKILQSFLSYTPPNISEYHERNKELNRLADLTREVEIHTDIYKTSSFSDENFFDPICPTIFFASRLNEAKTNGLYEIIEKHLTEEDKEIYGYGINFFFKNPTYKSVSVICMEFFHGYDTIFNTLSKMSKLPLRTIESLNEFDYENNPPGSERIRCLTLTLYEIVKLWEMGYKHGNLHPGNILVNMNAEYVCNKYTSMPRGRVFLIDFGRTKKHGVDYHGLFSRFLYNRSFIPQPKMPPSSRKWKRGKQYLIKKMFEEESVKSPTNWLFKYMQHFVTRKLGYYILWEEMEIYTRNRLQIYEDYISKKIKESAGENNLKKIESIKDELEKIKKSDENPMIIEEEDTYPEWDPEWDPELEGLDFLSTDSSEARLSPLSHEQLFHLYPPFSPNSLRELDILPPLTPELPLQDMANLPPRPPNSHSPPPSANSSPGLDMSVWDTQDNTINYPLPPPPRSPPRSSRSSRRRSPSPPSRSSRRRSRSSRSPPRNTRSKTGGYLSGIIRKPFSTLRSNKNNKSYHFSKKINYLRRKNNKTKKRYSSRQNKN